MQIVLWADALQTDGGGGSLTDALQTGHNMPSGTCCVS